MTAPSIPLPSRAANLKVRRFRMHTDAADTPRLLERTLGPSERHEVAAAQWGNDPDVCALVADVGGHVVGLGVARVEHRSPLECFPWFLEHNAAELEEFEQLEPFGSIQILAVAPSFRRSGIGLAVGRSLQRWLLDSGCAALFAVSWRHAGRGGSHGLLVREGYEKIAESRDFYSRMRDGVGHGCPYCGDACRCQAELYTLRFVPVLLGVGPAAADTTHAL